MNDDHPTSGVRVNYEYVVWSNPDAEIHRGPWTEEACRYWIEECRHIFPKAAADAIDSLYSVRRRAVGEWESYE